MVSRFIRFAASRLSPQLQQEVRRIKLVRQFGRGKLVSDEPEFARLAEWVRAGDSVIDIGANVGAYTMAMARLVGPEGRVFAFEPIRETFEILASVARRAGNVTLINAAVSDTPGIVRFSTPKWDTGLPNYYESAMTVDGELTVFALSIDSLALPKVSLVKIDAEGAEALVLKGMERLLLRDRPVLIVEGGSGVASFVGGLGYAEPLFSPGSPNAVFVPKVLGSRRVK